MRGFLAREAAVPGLNDRDRELARGSVSHREPEQQRSGGLPAMGRTRSLLMPLLRMPARCTPRSVAAVARGIFG